MGGPALFASLTIRTPTHHHNTTPLSTIPQSRASIISGYKWTVSVILEYAFLRGIRAIISPPGGSDEF
jgi:hypothetical protein